SRLSSCLSVLLHVLIAHHSCHFRLRTIRKVSNSETAPIAAVLAMLTRPVPTCTPTLGSSQAPAKALRILIEVGQSLDHTHRVQTCAPPPSQRSLTAPSWRGPISSRQQARSARCQSRTSHSH